MNQWRPLMCGRWRRLTIGTESEIAGADRQLAAARREQDGSVDGAGRWNRRSRAKEVSMPTIKDAAAEFLAHKRVAVTGVSRQPGGHGSNVVYRRLRERGYEVFAVNPNAEEVEGDRAYHDLSSIPGGVEAVVIGTRPEIAEETMRECAELGITRVWMHRGPGAGSVSRAAAAYGRQHGITVIDGGCPCMFDPTADVGHKAMRFVFTLTGNVPREV
jgi:predicted CoA-binding protein